MPMRVVGRKRRKTLHFTVTRAEEKMIRQRAKDMNMGLVEYLRFVSIPKG